jgi:hypothetical protein
MNLIMSRFVHSAFSKFRLNSAQFFREYAELHARYALPVGIATGFVGTSIACGYHAETLETSLPAIFGGTILGGVGMFAWPVVVSSFGLYKTGKYLAAKHSQNKDY